jgi:hypothetical protein
MEELGGRTLSSSTVKFNEKNAVMRVSELKQVHQREVSFQRGRRSHNTATITQTEKHSLLCWRAKLMNDNFREELGRHALAREEVDLRNRAREDEAYKRWEKAYAVWVRVVDLLDEREAARATAEEAATGEGILPSPVPEAVVYPAEPIYRLPPKLPPPDIPDIMVRAWAFLGRTFKEVTPELEKAYMFFCCTMVVGAADIGPCAPAGLGDRGGAANGGARVGSVGLGKSGQRDEASDNGQYS